MILPALVLCGIFTQHRKCTQVSGSRNHLQKSSCFRALHVLEPRDDFAFVGGRFVRACMRDGFARDVMTSAIRIYACGTPDARTGHALRHQRDG